METLFDQLRIARRGDDKIQKDVYEGADVDKSYYSRLEAGKENPTLKMMKKILDFIGYELVIRKKK